YSATRRSWSGAFDLGARRQERRERRRFADINSGTDANPDPALDFECDQRFAYRRSRYLQLFGKIALGRKPAAHAVFAAVDQGAELIGNLAIKASRFDGFERHARLSLTIPEGIDFSCFDRAKANKSAILA